MIKPVQLDIYKGTNGKYGALQFKPQPAHYVCSKCRSRNFEGPELVCKTREGEPTPPCRDAKTTLREGAIFLEATSATGPNVYDWENKVIIALGIVDMGKILFFLRTAKAEEKLSIVHDPGAKTPNEGKVIKSLYVESPKGITQGVFITVGVTEGEKKLMHKIPVSGSEALVIATLLQAFIPRALAWN